MLNISLIKQEQISDVVEPHCCCFTCQKICILVHPVLRFTQLGEGGYFSTKVNLLTLSNSSFACDWEKQTLLSVSFCSLLLSVCPLIAYANASHLIGFLCYFFQSLLYRRLKEADTRTDFEMYIPGI